MTNSVDTVKTEHSFSELLEFAADNDVEGFKRSVCDESELGVVGLWYGHQRLSKKRVLKHRTPLMVASEYGSVDVVKLILTLPEVDVNFSCGSDKFTALHCAASGGSVNAVDIVKLLLLSGANPDNVDANGHRAADVIVASPNLPTLKTALEELLKNNGSVCQLDSHMSTCTLGSSPTEEVPLFSASDSMLSAGNSKPNDAQHASSAKKEYPVDPSLPDIKNSIYTTDEFRMFSFKIQPCSRAYSHDWTECPFVHPGENARRRDPRMFNYSCVPCPEHRKGACRRGDLCEYAHGIFECWLHPAQYRTRLCKDGPSCRRRVCFFAHKTEELRSLYASSEVAMPSPQAVAMDFTAAMNLLSCSPSAISPMSHFPFTPPMSPSGNDIHLSMGWPQQNTTNLQILSNNLQGSRLRTLSGRYVPSEELNRYQDFELQQLQFLNDISSVSQPHRNASTNISAQLKQLNPKNLDRLLISEVSSPQNTDQLDASSMLSPPYKSVVLKKLQQQSMLSPIKTSVLSPKNIDHPLFQDSFARIDEPISPASSQLPVLDHNEKLQRGPASREFVSTDSWSKQKTADRNVDWSIHADAEGQLKKSSSHVHIGEEPDVSWVQSVLKESSSSSSSETIEGSSPSPLSKSNSNDHLGLPTWLEGMQLDQIVA